MFLFSRYKRALYTSPKGSRRPKSSLERKCWFEEFWSITFHALYHTRCYSMPLCSLIFSSQFTKLNTKTKQNQILQEHTQHFSSTLCVVHSRPTVLDARGQTGISVRWPTPSRSLHLDKDSLSASQNLFATRAWPLIWEEAHTLRE